MMANGQPKLIAPSAALATAPPRETPNVAHDRPVVHETRRDALEEVLAFKGEGSAPGLALASPAPPPPRTAKPPVTEHPMIPREALVAAAHETAMNPPPAPKGAPAAVADKAKAREAAPAPAAIAIREPGMGAPPPAAVAQAAPPVHLAASADAAPKEGVADAAKIEARLAALETAVKDRSNEGRARVEAEMAETHTLEKIAELGALVTRLTGQVKDLQDQVQSLSAGSDAKFVGLTRRVALGEVAGAERAGASGARAAPAAAAPESVGDSAARRVSADVKHSYRIQAASPGLALLSVVDASPDGRPVEVEIGTELPGYGKVRSIEQQGQAWVVKADRGSIQ